MSRHRGAKHRRQYELSSGISLFTLLLPCIATRFRLYHQLAKKLSGYQSLDQLRLRVDLNEKCFPYLPKVMLGTTFYPQRSFYSLSDGHSIMNHRITIPYLRTCSTCRSYSQACLCYCTLKLVSFQSKQTLWTSMILYYRTPSQRNYQVVTVPEGQWSSVTSQGFTLLSFDYPVSGYQHPQ